MIANREKRTKNARKMRARSLLKSLRKAWVTITRPQDRKKGKVLIISLSCVALCIFFRIIAWGSSDSVTDDANVNMKLQTLQGEGAFSEEAVERKYDEVWKVRRDNGSEAMGKDRMSIAYFIQVGADSVALLPRLFDRIHHEDNFYVVHIDAKVQESRRIWFKNFIEHNERYHKNMHMMESEMVTYKGISMVMNTIAGMTIALEKHPYWDYFINLSGADYPLVSPENQMKLLARPKAPLGRLNFISFFPEKEWVPYSFRVRLMHWDPAAVGIQNEANRLRLMRGFRTNPLEESRGYVFTKAEAWMILSRPFVSFVIRSSFAKRMLLNHVHILSVPEHYFADILYNHPFWKTTIVPDALRRVVWYLKNRRSGQHPYKLDAGPDPFTMWEYIETTKSLFARKFSRANSQMMDRVDLRQSGRGLNGTDQAEVNKYADDRRVFYGRIVSYFDDLTRTTLQGQGYNLDPNAYPNL